MILHNSVHFSGFLFFIVCRIRGKQHNKTMKPLESEISGSMPYPYKSQGYRRENPLTFPSLLICKLGIIPISPVYCQYK